MKRIREKIGRFGGKKCSERGVEDDDERKREEIEREGTQ